MKVHEIMTAHARCVGRENTLVEAAGLMREMDVGSLPVCEDDQVIGIITDRDMAIRAIAQGLDPSTTTVEEVMSGGVAHVAADDSVEQAARLMQERGIRRLPVLNRLKRIVGIISLADMAVSSNPAFSGIIVREVSQPVRPNGRDRRREELGRSAVGAIMPRSGTGAASEPPGKPKRRGDEGKPAKSRAEPTRRSNKGKKRAPAARASGPKKKTGSAARRR